MRELDEHITVGAKRLRCGYTTGTCAAAAARAAAELLFGCALDVVQIRVPAGIDVLIDVEMREAGDGWAQCAVRKDAGDDPDVTDGVYVVARVERFEGRGVTVEGAEGVGRVTRAGLDQPIGAAAINSVPRQMIAEQVREACQAHALDVDAGLLVTISVPGGAELAARTFNPRLGVEGGISIIGTSGIVKPMSEEAMIDSIRLEMRQLRAEGAERIVVVLGNYGAEFCRNELGISHNAVVMCSNYVGAALDEASRLGFSELLFVGHVGKAVKVAAGAMNTHSRVVDARVETLAAHAALAGASREVVASVFDAVTTDSALDAIDAAGLLDAVAQSLVKRLAFHLRKRAGESVSVEAVMFSRVRGLLASTSDAETLAKRWS